MRRRPIVSRARRVAALPLATAIALGGLVLAANPAYASITANWGSPTDNSTFTSNSPVDISVTLQRGILDSGSVDLKITVPGPNAGPFKVDTSSGSDSDLRFTFTPACPNHAGSCPSGSAPAYNGVYTAALSGSTTGQRTFRLQVPPAAPSGVTAAATGTHRVKVSWNSNREPDLTGYDVFDGDGTTIVTNLSKDATSYEFDLPSSGYGGTHSYVVRAHRLQCSNCGTAPGSDTQIDSPVSDPASVTFNEPGYTTSPSPGPSSSTDGGTTGGGSGYDTGNNGNGNGSGNNGNGNGGGGPAASPSASDGNYNSGNTGGSFSSGTTSADDQRRAFGLVFKSFAPKIGAPKLPPLPKLDPNAPLPWGTYDPTLKYGDHTTTETQKVSGDQSIAGQFVDSVTSVFEGRKLYRSIAIALLLFLAAAHLRLWLNKPHTS